MNLHHDHFQNEVWKPIPETHGIYEASSFGRVRSIDRLETQRNGRQYLRKGRILATHRNRNGYLQVSPRVDGKQFERMAHRLVLAAFTGEFPKNMQVCHINGNPQDNRIENLRWGTYSDNVYDRVRHGTHNQKSKTHCPQGHPLDVPNLTPSAIKRNARQCLACSRAHAQIARGKSKGIDQSSKLKEFSDAHYLKITSFFKKEEEPNDSL